MSHVAAKWSVAWLLVPLLLAGVQPAHAELYVIVNQDSSLTDITTMELSRIALGQQRQLQDGSPVALVDQSEVTRAFHVFHHLVTRRSNVQLTAYWARRVFTGRSRPPERLSGDREVLRAVSRNTALIGYLSEPPAAGNGRVRVILTLEEPEFPAR